MNFWENKIGDAVTKSNSDKIVKQEPVEEIKQTTTSIIIKMEHLKISKLLNDSTVSTFVTKRISK